MTKKSMIKNLGRIAMWPLTGLFRWAKLRIAPPLRVKVTRQSLMISLPASQGGRLHILPRQSAVGAQPSTFEVVEGDGQYMLQAGPNSFVLATYTSAAEAARALSTLNKALTGSLLWKWGSRAALAWVAWLFVTSYMEVVSHGTNATKPDVLGLGPAMGTVPAIPSGPAAFQSIPSVTAPDGGDLSEYIVRQAKAAQQKAQIEATPPKAGADNGAGLEAFGLKGASKEGCDPDLAFKVPQK